MVNLASYPNHDREMVDHDREMVDTCDKISIFDADRIIYWSVRLT